MATDVGTVETAASRSLSDPDLTLWAPVMVAPLVPLEALQ